MILLYRFFQNKILKLGNHVSLQKNISDQIKVAMKARDKHRTSVLRMLLSELKYVQSSNDAGVELSESEALKVVKTYHKRLTKSMADFPYEEKKDEIRSELVVVEEFLPAQASQEQIAEAVRQVLDQSEEKNFGIIMKAVLAKLGGNADGKLVSQAIKAQLGS